MQTRAALSAMTLALSMTLGCSGEEAIVSTSDTTPATDVTASEPVTTTTPPPATSATAQPATTGVPTTTSTITAPTSTTSLPAPAPSTEPLTVLAVDVDGVWLWTDENRRLVIDGSVGSAIPDRVGGIVYQNVETGAWRADQYGAPPNTAHWKWVGTGSAQPIRWLLRPGGTGEIVVEPPMDGMVRIVDTAIVDGHPTLAYLRTRHFTITVTDENPWWESRTADLVVRDLTTGVERVVRTQSIGWEYSIRKPSLGDELVAEAIDEYGDGGNWIELLGFDGTSIGIIDELADCEFSCSLVADLPPSGSRLAYALRRPYVAGQVTQDVGVSVLDRGSGLEQMRTTVTLPDDARPVGLDVVDGRILLVPVSSVSLHASAHPELRRGDRGAGVTVLQQRLSELDWPGSDDTYLAQDGVFGPRTEDAVLAFQTSARLDATGIVDTATWIQLISASGSIAQLHDPVVIEADGSSRVLRVLPSGTIPDRNSGPTMTLWSDEHLVRPTSLASGQS